MTAHLIGSPAYIKEFLAPGRSARERALLPLRQCGAYIDAEGVLQLPHLVTCLPHHTAATASGEASGQARATQWYAFDPDMPPDGKWLGLYAQAVREAYPRGLSRAFADAEGTGKSSANAAEPMPASGMQGPQSAFGGPGSFEAKGPVTAAELCAVHQFRMYLDRHNLTYIRTHYYPEAPSSRPSPAPAPVSAAQHTDLDRLKAYERDLRAAGGQGLYYDEPSRYHNKLLKGELFQVQVNDKIETWDRLSEFIVDTRSGMFVSQWDVLEEQVCGPEDRAAAPGEAGATDKEDMSGPAGMRTRIVLPSYIERDTEAQRSLLNSESFNYAGGGPAHFRFDILPAAAEAEKSLDYTYKQQLKSSTAWRNAERREYKEMFGKKQYDEPITYSQDASFEVGESLSDGALSRRRRKKQARIAKAQMKENKRAAKQERARKTQNAIVYAGIAALLAATVAAVAIYVKSDEE